MTAESLLDRLRSLEAALERRQERADESERLASAVAYQHAELERRAEQLAGAQRSIERLQGRLSVRAGNVLRRGARATQRAFGRGRRTPPAEVEPELVPPSERFYTDERYATWLSLYDAIGDEDRRLLRSRLGALAHRPLVSVVMPVFNTPVDYLCAAIDSVRSQVYERWELCIVDDASTDPAVHRTLARYAATDGRIRVERRGTNGHISAASNSALAMARGEWLALFDHDDILAEHALAVAVLALTERPDAGVLYSDEDHVRDDGSRFSPYFKPDFDPLLLCGQNYLAHLCMLRRDLVERVGGWRVGYEGSQDWDLVLRVTELLDPAQVVHVPHVLYHWRSHPGSTASSLAAKPYAADAARRAVADHLQRTGGRGSVTLVGSTGFTRVHWTLPDPLPRVSVVVLVRNGTRLVRCVDTVRMLSTYPDIEIVLVDDGGDHHPFRQFVAARHADFTVVRRDGDLSDPALRNAGAAAASGDVVCFIDDGIEVLSDRWVEEMVGLLLQPGVGAVGAKLLSQSGAVDHAGVVLGIGKTVGFPHRSAGRLEPGYYGRAILAQSFSAVSASCMAVRRQAFEDVGGFDEEHLAYAFSDVDLCLRLKDAGWRVAWSPFAEAVHHRDPHDSRLVGQADDRAARDVRYLRDRWGHALAADPAYNPNLSLAHETSSLAWPPRADWRSIGLRGTRLAASDPQQPEPAPQAPALDALTLPEVGRVAPPAAV